MDFPARTWNDAVRAEHPGCRASSLPCAFVMTDLAGWTFYLGIAVLGWTSIVLWTLQGWRWLRGRGLARPAAALLTVLLGALVMLGAWLPLDLYWVARTALRRLRRPPEGRDLGGVDSA